MTYPSSEEVEKADKLQLGEWLRFLPSPRKEDEKAQLNAILERFKAQGGWTPELSKTIGW